MTDSTRDAERLSRQGIVAVVRADRSEQLLRASEALLAGGVDCIEITMTTPNALEVIARCRKQLPEAFIGVGSVLEESVAQAAIDAGAQFVVSPIFKAGIIQTAHRSHCPCVAGCLTPTEMLTATEAGADFIKVFPAGRLGPQYFKDILAPMPHLKLTPTGGVDLTTAADWIAAGAVTLGVGSALVSKKLLVSENFAEIRRLAAEYVRLVAEARAAKG